VRGKNKQLECVALGHKFHFACIGTYFNRIRKMECPYCRKIDIHSRWRLAFISPQTDSLARYHSGTTTNQSRENEEDETIYELGCFLCNAEFGDLKPDIVLINCRHRFHLDCLGFYCNQQTRLVCPVCQVAEEGEWHCSYGITPADDQQLEESYFFQHFGQERDPRHMPYLLQYHGRHSRLGLHHNFYADEDEIPFQIPSFDGPGGSDGTRDGARGVAVGIEEGEGLGDSEVIDEEARFAAQERNDTSIQYNGVGIANSEQRFSHSCTGLLGRWFRAWRYGANGELRSLRIITISIILLAGFSLIHSRSFFVGNDISSGITYGISAVVPMLFCPGLLLMFPFIWYSLLFTLRGMNQSYTYSPAELVLEPLAMMNCLIMTFYWTKKNRLPGGSCCEFQTISEVYQ